MTAYEMRMSDWSSDVCSSDLIGIAAHNAPTTVRESPIVRTPFARNSLAVALALALPFALVACKQPAANPDTAAAAAATARSEEHTSELQSLMRISYAVFCLKKKIKYTIHTMKPNIYIIHSS